MLEISSVQRVSSEVNCEPRRVYMRISGSVTESRKGTPARADLEVLAFTVDFCCQVLEVFESFLNILRGRFVEIVVYPPRIGPILLQQSQVRLPARVPLSMLGTRGLAKTLTATFGALIERAHF